VYSWLKVKEFYNCS